jgi:transposase
MKTKMQDKYCEKLKEILQFFEKNKNQELKHSSYYDLLNNINISYINL